MALEAALGLAITVWSPEGDQLRTPPVDLGEGATAVHLQRDADGVYALVTDAQRYLARHAEHACRNPHCTKGEHGNPFRAARATKVQEHERRQSCLKCPQCGEDFADANGFETGLAALQRHVEQSKSVPCVGKAERDKRAVAHKLPGLVPFSIAADIEAVPEAGEAPRGVVFCTFVCGAQQKLSNHFCELAGGCETLDPRQHHHPVAVNPPPQVHPSPHDRDADDGPLKADNRVCRPALTWQRHDLLAPVHHKRCAAGHGTP